MKTLGSLFAGVGGFDLGFERAGFKTDIKRTCVHTDTITEAIAAMFDYPFTGETFFEAPKLPELPSCFGIGAIIGPSGSGKSTLLQRFRSDKPPITWDPTKAICSHFHSAEEAAARLSAVGLNSIPAWLRPYQSLSTGEQFRADLAIALESGAIFDEFTSTVDRNVAKACSYALRRHVDKQHLSNIIVASCHYDILEWLQPDWVFDTATEQLVVGRSKRRPEIEVEVVPCTIGIWPMFRPHHYLSGTLNPSARCWLALWRDTPVGFASAIAFPNGNFRNAWRGHRMVVLPDFQGLGIGVRLSDAVAEMFVSHGCRYFSKTAHPRLGAYRDASPMWRATSKNKKTRVDYESELGYATKEDNHKARHAHRLCYSHEYIGPVATVLEVPVTSA